MQSGWVQYVLDEIATFQIVVSFVSLYFITSYYVMSLVRCSQSLFLVFCINCFDPFKWAKLQVHQVLALGKLRMEKTTFAMKIDGLQPKIGKSTKSDIVSHKSWSQKKIHKPINWILQLDSKTKICISHIQCEFVRFDMWVTDAIASIVSVPPLYTLIKSFSILYDVKWHSTFRWFFSHSLFTRFHFISWHQSFSATRMSEQANERC